MAWTYSLDPATSDRDEIRFLIGDTEAGLELLQDAEIDYLINKWADVFDSNIWTASIAASIIANKFAGIVSVTADGVSVNTADLSTRYAETAMRLRDQYKNDSVGGGIDIANLMYDAELDESIKPLLFGIGMHDNRWAGQQNYGGKRNAYDSDRVGAPGESGL